MSDISKASRSKLAKKLINYSFTPGMLREKLSYSKVLHELDTLSGSSCISSINNLCSSIGNYFKITDTVHNFIVSNNGTARLFLSVQLAYCDSNARDMFFMYGIRNNEHNNVNDAFSYAVNEKEAETVLNSIISSIIRLNPSLKASDLKKEKWYKNFLAFKEAEINNANSEFNDKKAERIAIYGKSK